MMINLKCFSKILGVLFIASLVIFKLYEFSEKSQSFFIEKNKIVKNIDDIKHSELMLNYTVSASSLYLYKNNDTIIKSINTLHENIERLLQNKELKKSYPSIYVDIEKYRKMIHIKIEDVYEFQSYNSAIKNSTMYLAMLLKQFSAKRMPKPTLYKKNFVDAISTIFLSKNSIDKELLQSINIDYFKNVDLKNKDLNHLNKMFTAHLSIFKNYYPKYNALLLKILNSNSKEVLNNIDSEIYKVANKKLEAIEYALYFLVGFILLFTIFVITLIIKSEHENIKLNLLTDELQESIRLDNLTDIFNRFKFDEDVEKQYTSAFYLINIDKFKCINNYYGTKIGDKVLQKVADILNNIVQNNSQLKLYRLGADDFGILVLEKQKLNLEDIIFDYFAKNEINVGEFQFKISVSIAYSEDKPYFENASMALKKIKDSSRIKFLKYSESINNKEQLLQNILKTKTLYNAFETERLVPYFQGIVDVKTRKIVKYEVLSRVIQDDGRAESIFPYLQIAKDNKIYSKITKTVLYKSVELFSKNEIPFNINFSIEDIMDDSIIAILNKIAKENPKIMKHITFEILESESINDYGVIKKFIEDVKKVGAKVAIDDFGSGYSNFEHLINLDIDFIKLDGSLIKNIHKDKNAYNIVNLINKFAHDSNIQTVAEFVENEEIYQTLKKLGIDYAQGYHFSIPSKDLIT
jgi:diguanylate cyclase (GGDEF)-like protein